MPQSRLPTQKILAHEPFTKSAFPVNKDCNMRPHEFRWYKSLRLYMCARKGCFRLRCTPGYQGTSHDLCDNHLLKLSLAISDMYYDWYTKGVSLGISPSLSLRTSISQGVSQVAQPCARPRNPSSFAPKLLRWQAHHQQPHNKEPKPTRSPVQKGTQYSTDMSQSTCRVDIFNTL